ncbi:unnamed protein product [Thlaspi arvense]|uniref:RRM domain-containing protein n=1 Tax=Thlaspi arvense TaxID=13288 RepID=A0AAU9SNK8_THLAR|nr:unnamed protein product [Thlaspi arvense]
MSQPQNLDTTYTKIFVGGLPWVTRSEGLRSFFQQFGEIIHVNVVCDRATKRSKGYGFVTFKDAESATRACVNPSPKIDGRIATCKLASDGQNINQNQPNITGFRSDDLCYLSQSFMQNQQQFAYLQQPPATYVVPYWNQHYQQDYSQYNLPWQYAPQGYNPQYDPQYYQNYFVVDTNITYQQHPSTSVPRDNRAEYQGLTIRSLPSSPKDSPTLNDETNPMSDESSQN